MKTVSGKWTKKATATAVAFAYAGSNRDQLRGQEDFSALDTAGELDLKQILAVGVTIITENGSCVAI